MDYERLKQEVVTIGEIAEQVPEAFRERCFELLLGKLLDSTPGSTPQEVAPPESNDVLRGESEPGTIPTPSSVRVFMQRTGVTSDDLARVLMFDEDEAHFIREPEGLKVAKGQMEWALILALKNGIENNRLTADPEAVRSICQEKGYYDKGNFAANFKKPANAKLFRKALVPQGTSELLTNEGQDELGKIVKRLAGTAG